MFPIRYFCNEYFAPRYFPKSGAEVVAAGVICGILSIAPSASVTDVLIAVLSSGILELTNVSGSASIDVNTSGQTEIEPNTDGTVEIERC